MGSTPGQRKFFKLCFTILGRTIARSCGPGAVECRWARGAVRALSVLFLVRSGTEIARTGFRLSPLYKCHYPQAPSERAGQLDRDVTDLTILIQ